MHVRRVCVTRSLRMTETVPNVYLMLDHQDHPDTLWYADAEHRFCDICGWHVLEDCYYHCQECDDYDICGRCAPEFLAAHAHIFHRVREPMVPGSRREIVDREIRRWALALYRLGIEIIYYAPYYYFTGIGEERYTTLLERPWPVCYPTDSPPSPEEMAVVLNNTQRKALFPDAVSNAFCVTVLSSRHGEKVVVDFL
jgi:hypothetical protein